MVERLGRVLRAYANKDGRGYPDWAIRYMPIVRRLRPRRLRNARVLEIGANENGLARFAGVPVIAVDLAIDHLRAAREAQDVRPVMADAAALPFRTGSVDICACVDTLEHLAPEARPGACAEIVRVLGPTGTGVVAFPSGAGASEAEASIREAYARACGETLSWLEQHAALGLPQAEEARDVLASNLPASHRLVIAKNATLWVWRLLWRILLCGWPGRGNAAFQALARLATPILCRCHVGRCYRTVIWLEPKDL